MANFRGIFGTVTVSDINREREARGEKPIATSFGAPVAGRQLPLTFAKYTAPVDFPLGHKLALLKRRKGELADKVLHSLAAMSAPEPTDADRDEMIRQGYLTKTWKPDGFNQKREVVEITPRGLFIAQDIALDLARRLHLHHVEYRFSKANSGHSASCPCGWCAVASRTHSGFNSLQRYGSQHLAKVRAGTELPIYSYAAGSSLLTGPPPVIKPGLQS